MPCKFSSLRKKFNIFRRSQVSNGEVVEKRQRISTSDINKKQSVSLSFTEPPEFVSNTIISKKIDPVFSSAAVKLMLDNLVDEKDVQQIFDYDNAIMQKSRLNIEEDCAHCGKHGSAADICCPVKETEMYLLDRSLKKLKQINDYQDDLLVPLEWLGPIEQTKPEAKPPHIAEEKMKKLRNLKLDKSVPTFIRIQKRLNNMKKYYPKIYFHKDSIIDAWTNCQELGPIDQNVLDFDDDIDTIHWL